MAKSGYCEKHKVTWASVADICPRCEDEMNADCNDSDATVCRHGLSIFSSRGCWNCIVEENELFKQRLEAIAQNTSDDRIWRLARGLDDEMLDKLISGHATCQDGCNWVSADNEVVSGAEICTKCFTVRPV